ncbi:Hypothetical predicted protein [Olea europaea subsp. europaea]|uniref:Uncharacterized protein n=1 Tax=Olea europaea subsp. europaea TaxID=158383 RepID=A0A8S0U637_OLEEU|nr:Hypothetical predicted protein [Olea europaea subsp. europaea]
MVWERADLVEISDNREFRRRWRQIFAVCRGRHPSDELPYKKYSDKTNRSTTPHTSIDRHHRHHTNTSTRSPSHTITITIAATTTTICTTTSITTTILPFVKPYPPTPNQLGTRHRSPHSTANILHLVDTRSYTDLSSLSTIPSTHLAGPPLQYSSNRHHTTLPLDPTIEQPSSLTWSNPLSTFPSLHIVRCYSLSRGSHKRSFAATSPATTI